MIELPLPERVERQLIRTSRRTVTALRGVPDPGTENGHDVVMVSGFFGTKEDSRDLLSLVAAAGFRGWAYDYSGQLDLDTDHLGYSIAEMADDLTEVIPAATGGRPAHIVGHCLGGFVARAAVVSQPWLVRSLTLLACGPSLQDRKHKAMLNSMAQLHANGGTIALWPLVKTLLAEDDTIMREFWHTKLATMNQRWVTGTAESMADEPDRSAELTAAGIPSLVVHGKRDRRLWSHDAYAEMASRLGANRVIIEKASHSPNMEQPGQLAAALVEFWTTTGARVGDLMAGAR